MGSFFKLLVKVLANRLKGVTRNLVNKAQNAFVGGRQILDSSLIANEVIESMINGSIAGFLRSSRGLRQGDPLSPYLFVLGMEAFSVLIERVVSEGFLAGYKITNRNREEEKIIHLLFADDMLVFCRDLREEMVDLS